MENQYGILCKYEDNSELRAATREELEESIEAAKNDGGAGVFKGYHDMRSVYVQGGQLD